MKNILFLLAIAVLVSSCSSSKDVTATTQGSKKDKKLAELAVIKQAVESRRYIVKVSKLYMPYGGTAELVPKFNYIVVDGEVASVSLGYLGRSSGGRKITGINFHGHTVKYEMVNDAAKGKYDVSMKVAKGNDTFDFYITIQPSGTCTVSMNNLFIQSVSYRGEVVPVTVAQNRPAENKDQY
jgi:uncharacterized protein YceK